LAPTPLELPRSPHQIPARLAPDGHPEGRASIVINGSTVENILVTIEVFNSTFHINSRNQAEVNAPTARQIPFCELGTKSLLPYRTYEENHRWFEESAPRYVIQIQNENDPSELITIPVREHKRE